MGLPPSWMAAVAGVVLGLALMVQAEAADRSGTNALLEIRRLVVDGSRVEFTPGATVRLDRQPRTVVFIFGPATNLVSPAIRFRFRLDGYEEGWREQPAEMRLCLRFLDRSGDQVGETIFRASGQTEGWTGDLQTARFAHRRETVLVPPDARSFWVVMTSAGPPAAVGAFAIADLVIQTSLSGDAAPAISLSQAFDAAGGGSSGGVPAGWMRDGLHPSMARTLAPSPGGRTQGLAIVDDDLGAHAEWHTVKELATPVTPGEQLRVEWKEAYSLGLAGEVSVQYVNLPAGYYRFRLNEVSVMGEPGEAEVSLALAVPQAFWQTPWFWVSMATIALAAALGAWRYTVWQRLRRPLLRLEQQRAVDRERLRIAQDIHDDLGARVTQISLSTAMAQGRTDLPEVARAEFGKVSQMTRELVSALYETVWAVNPENDNLDALANYLCQMANQLCSQARLRCRLEVPDLPPQVPLSSQVRHTLIMAVKDALHNVITHARASEVRLRITFTHSLLTIGVQDDGRGFDPATCQPGYGLANLKRRMQDLGGEATVESRPSAGTTVCFRLPVAATEAAAHESPV